MSKQTGNQGNKNVSTYSVTKPYGGMHGFMRSYGVKPGEYGEAMEIINVLKENSSSQGGSGRKK